MKRLRQRQGMSAERLSLAIKLHPKRIRDIEQGAARLRVDILVLAAEALGVSPVRFFDDEPSSDEVAA
jgi:transcriptional regulator with XRE-family HTH domain